MNDQSSTTTNTHSQPVLCKNSCGFFGSNATGNMCSKCFNRIQKANKKEGGDSVTIATQAPKPMEIDTPQPTPTPVTGRTDTVASCGVHTVKFSDSVTSPGNKEVTMLAPSSSLKKKKKKKQSYKSMMASMTQNTKSAADIQKEKEHLRKVTGGGAFLKIDKI